MANIIIFKNSYDTVCRIKVGGKKIGQGREGSGGEEEGEATGWEEGRDARGRGQARGEGMQRLQEKLFWVYLVFLF